MMPLPAAVAADDDDDNATRAVLRCSSVEAERGVDEDGDEEEDEELLPGDTMVRPTTPEGDTTDPKGKGADEDEENRALVPSWLFPVAAPVPVGAAEEEGESRSIGGRWPIGELISAVLLPPSLPLGAEVDEGERDIIACSSPPPSPSPSSGTSTTGATGVSPVLPSSQ